MDGTTLETVEDIATAVNYALKKYSFKERSLDEFPSFLGDGSKKLIQRAIGCETSPLFDEVFSCYKKYYMNHATIFTKPYDGLVEALKYAKSKGIDLYIYTNKPEDIAIEVLDHCFEKDLFKRLVGVTDYRLTKPNPIPFLDKTKEDDIDYDKACYFGDSTIDLDTGNNLKCRYIFSVLWGYQSFEKLSSYSIKPTAFLTKREEIKEIVDHLVEKYGQIL